MNRVFKLSLVICVFVLVATVVSCTKTCDAGYEGKRCDVPIRDKFLGSWNVVDNPGNLMYGDTVSEGVDILDVNISRSCCMDTFHRLVRATIDGNSIHIATQRSSYLKPILVDGTGTISSDQKTILWNYNLTDTSQTPAVVTAYTGTWTK